MIGTALLEGLFRVVALDGSVWWTTEPYIENVKARETWKIPGDFSDGGYAKLMGPKTHRKVEVKL